MSMRLLRFFLTEQNRTLLTNPDGSLTDRAKDVVRATPFGRMGEAEELNGAIVYLASDASKVCHWRCVANRWWV